MTAKEEALRIYTKFNVHNWSEVDGYLPDDIATLKTCLNVVTEIKRFVYDIDTRNDIEAYQSRQSTLRHLTSVIEELKKI
jgi:hypothetical protein